MPSLDVVVPCYQYGHFLRACVESVLTQDVEDLRVLIIDNASTDDSPAVARALAAEDPRVEVLLRTCNMGPQASYNDGIDWAAGSYFLILCADDVVAPGALSRALLFMEAHPRTAFLHGEAVTVAGDGPVHPVPSLHSGPGRERWGILSGHDFIARFCRSGYFRIAGSSVFVRTKAQKRAGHYRPSLPHTDDYEMWLRLALLGDVAETTAVQAGLRLHGDNLTTRLSRGPDWEIMQAKAAADSFFSHEGAALPDAERLHRQAVGSMAARAYWSACSNLWRGHRRQAAALFAAAVALRPSTRFVPPVDYLLTRPEGLRRISQVVAERLSRPFRTA